MDPSAQELAAILRREATQARQIQVDTGMFPAQVILTADFAELVAKYLDGGVSLNPRGGHPHNLLLDSSGEPWPASDEIEAAFKIMDQYYVKATTKRAVRLVYNALRARR